MAVLYLPVVSLETGAPLGLLGRSALLPRLLEARLPVRLRLPTPDRLRDHLIGGKVRCVADPITFTPFASARPCSARCVFCSETLVHGDARLLSASLRPASDYADGLRQALSQLAGLPFSVSLSGLEASDDPDWLEAVIAGLDDHERRAGLVQEKVLYTNAAGLARQTSGTRLLPLLRDYQLTRAEVSRHHPHQTINDTIMRFRPGQPIAEQEVFEQTVRDLHDHAPVRLVCVLQATGVACLDDVLTYLAWARRLGVRDVVFRELSRLGGDYLPNSTFRIVQRERVGLEPIVADLLDRLEKGKLILEPEALTAGYYFWNLQLRGPDGMLVTLETSDYYEMKQRHASEVVYKLVYHANGNLCGDWSPERQVLWSWRGKADGGRNGD